MTHTPGSFATRFEPVGAPVGTAIALPGRAPQYSAVLLGCAAQVLTQHGWIVTQMWWDPPAHETEEQAVDWACRHLAEAAPDSGRVLVVGKSLGTYAAPLAAERGYDAIWLTPPLTGASLVDAFSGSPARQLLVGGAADPVWDSEVARDLAGEGCDVLEVPGADHGMLVPGDVVRGAEIQVEIVRAMDGFLESLRV